MRSYRAQGPLPGFYHYYPGVPAVVGVRVEERVNFCPAVWNTGLSKRVTFDVARNDPTLKELLIDLLYAVADAD